MRIDSVLALTVAVMVCIGLITVAGIGTNGDPGESGVFGALGELVKTLLPNFKFKSQ